MTLNNGFNESGFMAYLGNQFPSVFSGNGCGYTRELVENLVGYALKYENQSKDMVCYFISEMLPEVTFGEVALFMEDKSLTDDYGILEKANCLNSMGWPDESEIGIVR